MYFESDIIWQWVNASYCEGVHDCCRVLAGILLQAFADGLDGILGSVVKNNIQSICIMTYRHFIYIQPYSKQFGFIVNGHFSTLTN